MTTLKHYAKEGSKQIVNGEKYYSIHPYFGTYSKKYLVSKNGMIFNINTNKIMKHKPNAKKSKQIQFYDNGKKTDYCANLTKIVMYTFCPTVKPGDFESMSVKDKIQLFELYPHLQTVFPGLFSFWAEPEPVIPGFIKRVES
jgi:predicted peptidase